jgi:NADPH:quinone reductase-like Zn-dependent oxidoreductase
VGKTFDTALRSNEEALMTRSVRIHDFGGPEVLRIEDVETEQPGGAEVRLRIRAIGINRTEITLRSGRSPARPSLPTKIGWEAAGEIDALGADVKGFASGDRVALVPAYAPSRYGLYGERSLAPARSLVKIPDGVSFEQAAATWASFGTAWAGLVAVGKLAAGQTVLVPAASSSVGLAAIQIANRIGPGRLRSLALRRRPTSFARKERRQSSRPTSRRL